jgi:hypothetical protein
MSRQEPSAVDDFLDLLIEALEERQRQRRVSGGNGAAPPAGQAAASGPAVAPPPAETVFAGQALPGAPRTASAAVPEATPLPGRPAVEPPRHFATLAALAQVDPAEVELPPEPGWAETEAAPAERHLDRTLARLFAALAVLLIVVNIPYNRYGTNLARALPDTASLIIRDGLVLKGSGDEIYVLEDNRLRWITSLDAFEWYGYRWEQVHVVDNAFLDDFAMGRPIHLLLKCETSPHVYAYEAGQKRWIKDIPTFEAQGYRWEDIQFLSCGELRRMPDGSPIPEDAGPPPQP